MKNWYIKVAVVVGAVVGAVVVLYYIMSPYQNCMRVMPAGFDLCLQWTSW